MRILACVDSSNYAPAVCDYAAWLTGPFAQAVSLFHAIESQSEAAFRDTEVILAAASARLRDSGLDDVRGISQRGRFVDLAEVLAPSHSVLVVGKRGSGGGEDRSRLGSSIEPLLRRTESAVCLVSTLFLPVSRALVLLDADPDHRRTVEFVRRHPWLSELDTDVVVMAEEGGGEAKLAWAREVLGAGGADIFPLDAEGPHEALERYRQSHPIDLLVLSREVALADNATPLRKIEADSLWAWRAPVLIC